MMSAMPTTAPITIPAIAPPERPEEGEGVAVSEEAASVADVLGEVVVVLLCVEVVLLELEVVLEAVDEDGLAEASTDAIRAVFP
jgi:hypothetical protein